MYTILIKIALEKMFILYEYRKIFQFGTLFKKHFNKAKVFEDTK